jgi:hypothetical protein
MQLGAARAAEVVVGRDPAGLADNLLTCVVRAWDFADKPLLVRLP